MLSNYVLFFFISNGLFSFLRLCPLRNPCFWAVRLDFMLYPKYFWLADNNNKKKSEKRKTMANKIIIIIIKKIKIPACVHNQ